MIWWYIFHDMLFVMLLVKMKNKMFTRKRKFKKRFVLNLGLQFSSKHSGTKILQKPQAWKAPSILYCVVIKQKEMQHGSYFPQKMFWYTIFWHLLGNYVRRTHLLVAKHNSNWCQKNPVDIWYLKNFQIYSKYHIGF